MLILTVVQFTDLKMQRSNFKAGLNRPYTPLLNQSAWDNQIGKEARFLYYYPKFRCGKADTLTTLIPAMNYVSLHNLKMNTGYIARHQPPCDEDSVKSEIAGADIHQSVFVFVKSEFSDIAHIKRLLPDSESAQCEDVDFAMICHFKR